MVLKYVNALRCGANDKLSSKFISKSYVICVQFNINGCDVLTDATL